MVVITWETKHDFPFYLASAFQTGSVKYYLDMGISEGKKKKKVVNTICLPNYRNSLTK